MSIPAPPQLSSVYCGQIIAGMQAAAAAADGDPTVDKRLEEARKVLYVADDDGDLL